MVNLVDVLSVFLMTIVSSLFEESSRIKIAKSIVLIGETLIVLSILDYFLNNMLAYVILLITCFVIVVVGFTYALRKLSDLINNIVLDTYLCLYVGENCRELLGEDIGEKKPLELLIDKVSELLTNEWSPIEEAIKLISKTKSPKGVVKLFLCLLLYQFSIPIFTAVFFSTILKATGLTELVSSVVKIPVWGLGLIIITLSIVLVISSTTIFEETNTKKERDSQYLHLLSSKDIFRKFMRKPKSRLEGLLFKSVFVWNSINPNYSRFDLEIPVATPINLYECSTLLCEIIGQYIKKLENRGFKVEVYGNLNDICRKCEETIGVTKYVELHDKESPIEVFSELTLAGEPSNKIAEKHGVKVLVKERIKKSSNGKTHESTLESNEKKHEESTRVIAAMVVRAWKGCVKYIRIKPSKKSGNRKEREKSRTLYILKPRRTLSIIIVGRRDIASLINSMVVTYLRPASSENILCIDEDSETTVDKNKNHSNRLKPISNKLI